MTLHDSPDTDGSLYIELTEAISHETREIASGLNIDFDASGDGIAIDIDHASRKLDLTRLETTALPVTSTFAA